MVKKYVIRKENTIIFERLRRDITIIHKKKQTKGIEIEFLKMRRNDLEIFKLHRFYPGHSQPQTLVNNVRAMI